AARSRTKSSGAISTAGQAVRALETRSWSVRSSPASRSAWGSAWGSALGSVSSSASRKMSESVALISLHPYPSCVPFLRMLPHNRTSMAVAASGCLNDDEVIAFVERETSDEDSIRIKQHLDICDDCRAIVAETAKLYYQDTTGSSETVIARPI